MLQVCNLPQASTGVINTAKRQSRTESTGFPQGQVTLCKTCEKDFFFARNVSTDSNLAPVEKKSRESVLICCCGVQ